MQLCVTMNLVGIIFIVWLQKFSSSPLHGGHYPNVQNCTGKCKLNADENVHIDIGEGVDIF